MLKKLNQKTIFIGVTCCISVLIALAFEFIVNKVFPQPTFFFNRNRVIAVTGCLASLACLIKYRQYFYTHLHKAFLLIALVFGISFTLVFPRAVYLSPDDQIHFKNAYFFMEDVTELKGGFAVIESAGFTDLNGKGFDEMAAVYSAMDEANQTIIDTQYRTGASLHFYNSIAYLPFYLGFKVSNFLHLSFTTGVVIAKLCSLACYILLIYFAIKLSGKFSKLFFVVGLLTCNLFLATQFSYDPLVIASLLLAISLFLHVRQSERVSMKALLGFILVAALGSLTKAVYCPILLLALMIPKAKFDCKGRAIAYKVCAMLVMLVLASTFILPILGGGLASDIRGGNTSVGGQIGFLLSNPLKALAVVCVYTTSQLPNLVFEPTLAFVSLGAVATAAPIYELCKPVIPLVGILSFIIVLWVTFRTGLAGTTITRRSKIGLALIYLVLTGAITASMYLSFTEVGSLRVDGVQPRYLMPFFPLLLIVLMPARDSQSEKNVYDYATLFVPYVCLALILATYVLRMSML